MAEYNKVMTQIKPDLPKVIDTEQIYVYVPKASYDQAGIMKPDKTQFVIAGDYTLTIKHFTMTDDRVSVDVNMGYDNDTAVSDLGDKDFVTKGNLTGYALKKLENNTATDKAYVEGANGTGTKLVDVSDGVDGGSIVKRDAQGRIFGKTTGTAGDNELVNLGYVSSNYVKKSGVANRVYTTDSNGADSVAQFSNNAIGNTMAYRAYDGSLRGKVTTPEPTTLLNKEYADNTYIPVGSDGKIPNSYLPADIGADEIVSGYYINGEFWDEFDAWEQENTWLINETPTTIFYNETETPMPYFKSYGTATIRTLSADNVLSGTVESSKMFQWMDDAQRLRFAKKNDETAGVACDVVQGAWSYKVSNGTTYQATNASIKQALRTIVFSRRPDDKTFLDWLKDNAVQTVGPTPVAGDPDKLYVDLNTNKTYRWEQYTGYVQVGSSLALGTTHESAYYGDFGDKAYRHSQATGNPHNTQITDITGLKSTLDSKVSVYDSSANDNRVVAFIADQNSPVMCTLYNYDNSGAIYYKSIGTTTWKRLYSTNLNPGITFLRDKYEPQIKIEARFTPIINGVRMTSPEITLPMAMHIDVEFDKNTSGNDTNTYLLNFKQSDEKYIVYTWPCMWENFSIFKRYKVPLYSSNGTLRTNSPVISEDCINLGYWQTNYKPFNYTTISTLSAVEHGFNVEYQIDGKSAEIEIPLEGTDDIIVDIDETNKMINIHLDAKVRAKLAKMLTLPAEAPAKNSIVGVGTNNAQMIMTEQEARDAISVYKTLSITQTDYDNLAVKDNKTLYLITG